MHPVTTVLMPLKASFSCRGKVWPNNLGVDDTAEKAAEDTAVLLVAAGAAQSDWPAAASSVWPPRETVDTQYAGDGMLAMIMQYVYFVFE